MTCFKRIFHLFLAIVFIGSAVSCGSDNGDQESKSDIQQISERDKGFGTSAKTDGKTSTQKKKEIFKGRRISQVTFSPEKPNIYTPLSVQAKFRAENLQNTVLNYTFWKNSRKLKEGKENSVPAFTYEKGDTVYVDVILIADGKEVERKRSKTVIFLNSRPQITNVVFPEIRGNGTYRIIVQTVNHDKDSLTFSINGENLPPGLEIDQKTGVITFRLDDTPERDVKFEVVVRDNDGGEDRRKVTINFSKETQED